MKEYNKEVKKYRELLPDELHDGYEYLLAQSCYPRLACASTHYAAGLVNNYRITQDKIAEHYDVSVPSIRKRYQELVDYMMANDQLDLAVPNFEDWTTLEGELDHGSKEERIAEVAGLYLDSERTHLSQEDILDITESKDSLQALRTLFDMGLDIEGDMSVTISLNKQGLSKLIDRKE